MPSFLGTANSPEGENGTLDVDIQQLGTHVYFNTSRFQILQYMSHFFMMGDSSERTVPVLKTFDPAFYRVVPLNGSTIVFLVPFGLCRENDVELLPQFTIMDYDPQFSSVFIEPPRKPSLQTKGNPPNAKALGIAMGVAFGGVVTLVAVVVVVWLVSDGKKTKKSKAQLQTGDDLNK